MNILNGCFRPGHQKTTYANAGFKEIKITQPFALEKPSGSNKVVMVVARQDEKEGFEEIYYDGFSFFRVSATTDPTYITSVQSSI